MSWQLPQQNAYDDFETSLDRALSSANNQYSWSGSRRPLGSTSSRHSLSGAIPLAELHSQGDDNDSDHETAQDSLLLAPARAYVQPPRRGLWAAVYGFFHRQLDSYHIIRTEIIQNSLERQTGPAGAEDQREISPRNQHQHKGHMSNSVSNAKYNPVTFLPVILYEQFKFFFNLYFLVVALLQAVPQLRIGYLSSYVVPLAFVLVVTMMKEAGDDIARRKRDIAQNNELYEVLNRPRVLGPDVELVPLKSLRVGDLVRLHKNSRVPADMVLLQSSDASGEAFIKTDQLDGETDWKLRVACPATQNILDAQALIDSVSLIVGKPTKSIHKFDGQLFVHQPAGHPHKSVALTVDQTLWASTVLALGTALGMVVYTGAETRQLLNTTMSGVKIGLLEMEINLLSKILCVSVFVLSAGLVAAQQWPLKHAWYIDVMRFLILFSTIIPVSLRVNLDLAKSVYASQIQKDRHIPNTIVRTLTIPEDLGRVEYLLSDKTGTLTQNDMEMKKLHLGAVCYAGDTLDIVADSVRNCNYKQTDLGAAKRDLGTRVADFALVLALCHNVTPSVEDDGSVLYQAASPDEIAIVKFCDRVGLRLLKRDRKSITILHKSSAQQLAFEILYNFPFNSDTKRMGLVVRSVASNEAWFVEKGADTVMALIVQRSDWLDEETVNMAREGLRTLVVGRKRLGAQQLQDFVLAYDKAALSMHGRDTLIQQSISQHLETDLELLGLTGVEDKLQEYVKNSIELLRNAGVKIWMLTGDKVETAKCVAISAKLISRGQAVTHITRVTSPDTALLALDQIPRNANSVVIIDGESMAVYLHHFPKEFFEVALGLPAVVACRCTPQQKADIATLIKSYTGKRVCCIGDGGNDVSMIQCADVGVGIVGKEGKQASLAADFSVDKFHYLLKLLLWHGRNLYKRSAKLLQFIIHRGLIISVAQAIYLICSRFEPLALYQGWLMVGYSTVYTMAPVFSLTLDQDIDEKLTKLYPELYKELTLGKSLSYKTFFIWVAISLFQGSVIQLLAQYFQGLGRASFRAMVSVSFTCLIMNELLMVAMTIRTWNKVMLATMVVTLAVYVGSVPFLTDYFDLDYITSLAYYWQTAVVLAASMVPVWCIGAINQRMNPPSYAKVQS